MKRLPILKLVIAGMLCTFLLAGCGKSGDNSVTTEKTSLESTQSTETEQTVENESKENKSEESVEAIESGASEETAEETEEVSSKEEEKKQADSVGSEDEKLQGPPYIDVQFTEGQLEEVPEYVEFDADQSEYRTQIIIRGKKELSDVSFNSLFLTDYDENSGMIFDVTPVYHMDSLTPNQPLVVNMTFWGDTPSYGISFKTADGMVYSYAIEMSGMDGSVILQEY